MLNKRAATKHLQEKKAATVVFITSLAKKEKKKRESHDGGLLAFEINTHAPWQPGQGDKRIKETTQTAETLVEYQQGAKDRSLCVVHTAVAVSSSHGSPRITTAPTRTHTQRARKRKKKKETNGV